MIEPAVEEVTVGGAVVVIARIWESRPRELVAVMVTFRVPEAVGVPLIIPLLVSTAKPFGRFVAP